MPKNSSISSFKNLPAAFLLCLLLLTATELAARHFSYLYMEETDLILLDKKRLAETRHALNFDVLLMGDSRVQAVNPAVFSDALFKTDGNSPAVYNFSFHYQDIRSYYLFLEKYLKTRTTPKIILFSVMPEAIFKGWNITGPMEDKYSYIHRFTLMFNLDDMPRALPAGFVIRNLLVPETEQLSYLIHYRRYIKNFLTLSNSVTVEARRKFCEDWEAAQEKDYGSIYWVPQFEVNLAQLSSSPFYSQDTGLNNDSVFWFEEFLRLADKNSIHIILFNTPVIGPIYDIREKNGFNTRYKATVEEIASKYNNVTLLFPLLESYDTMYFADSYHLNKKGLERFLPQLLARMREHVQ